MFDHAQVATRPSVSRREGGVREEVNYRDASTSNYG